MHRVSMILDFENADAAQRFFLALQEGTLTTTPARFPLLPGMREVKAAIVTYDIFPAPRKQEMVEL